ncbi:MAG TPA: diguanylate cyclase [Candidatus Limnocylindrales bacterium]|nr:diguanylate cyclase [Candidatus Limnocylindrales bacterium]
MASTWVRIFRDPYVFYTASLLPIVWVVSLTTAAGDFWVATALGSAALAAQLLLGYLGIRRHQQAHVGWQLLRLIPPLAFVAIASLTVGGSSLPLIPLFIPVVAGAAAAGKVQGVVATAVAVAVMLSELASLSSSSGIGLRGMTLAGVTIVVAFGTRRIVRALEDALAGARTAVVAAGHRAHQIAALESVGRLFAAGGPAAESIAAVVDVVVRRFGYTHVSVYLGDSERVHLTAHGGYVEAIASFDSSVGVAGRVMRSHELAFVPDVAADPDYIPGTLTATSLICAPLFIDGRFLGLLNVETTGSRRLDETDRSLVVIIAARIASAVALGQDRRELSARADLFRDVEAFGRDVTSSLAVEPLAEMMIEAIGRVVTADVLAVSLLDRKDGRYIIRAARGLPGVAGHEIQVGEGLAGRAIRDRAIVIDNALTPEQFSQSIQDLKLPIWKFGVGLPLVRDGVVVGAISIGRTTGPEGFSELELEGLQLLASSAALAVANAFLHAEVADLAVRDPLTGLYNRRHFDEALDRVLAVHRRERLTGWRPLSAIMFDLDRFGLFNKEHGHQVGDVVLKAFAEVLASRFRASDLLARVGGEEFIVVLDDADREAAVRAADEVRGLLAERIVLAEDGTELRVTVSAGCAELDAADPTRESLLRTADVALFMAKRAGRDRVVAA